MRLYSNVFVSKGFVGDDLSFELQVDFFRQSPDVREKEQRGQSEHEYTDLEVTEQQSEG